MPAKNSTKTYVENGYYHIYNRGVEKRAIFLDGQDYEVFLSYLKEYLSPKDEKGLFQKLSDPYSSSKEKDKIIKFLRLNNFNREIKLLAYCLMPNHFHLFVKQKTTQSIDKFMSSMATRYSMYFNQKYSRVGALYQGRYKAALITSESHFLHLTRYIHKQALIIQGMTWREIQPCSYSDYIGTRKTPWVFPEEILSFFSKTSPAFSYERFISDSEDSDLLRSITLEED